MQSRSSFGFAEGKDANLNNTIVRAQPLFRVHNTTIFISIFCGHLRSEIAPMRCTYGKGDPYDELLSGPTH